MNYIILNGVNSNTITGLIIQELPPISKPLMRTQIDQIDGRDGDIVTKLGYATVDKELSIGLHGSFDIDSVIEYFASEGTVIFSNESDKYYRYQVLDQIDFERLVRFRTATVTMHCQPYKYEVDEEPIEEAGSTDSTGDIVTFNTQSTDAVGVEASIEPYQNLNGYDSPWVGGAGKNKCNPSEYESGLLASSIGSSINSVTASTRYFHTGIYDATQQITITITTKDLSKIDYGAVLLYNSDQVAWTSAQVFTSSVKTKSWTISANTYEKIRINIGAPSGVTADASYVEVQIELGSTATAWTPYENICPIYPNNGKNLYDSSTKEDGYISATGVVTVDGSSVHSALIPVTPNQPIVFSGLTVGSGGGSTKRLHGYDSNGTWVQQLGYASNVQDGTRYTISATVPSGITGVKISFRGTDEQVQVEHGTSPSAYVPYNAIGITRTGANFWDEQWETGTISGTTGRNVSDVSRIRSRNYIRVVPNEIYYVHVNYSNSFDGTLQFIGYGKDKNFISTMGWYGNPGHVLLTIPNNVYYVRFIGTSGRGATYTQNDISINSPSNASQYEPYTAERYYPISNNPVYGGTLEVETGVLTVTHQFVDLGSLTWAKSSPRFYSMFSTSAINCPKAPSSDTSYIANAICSQYSVTSRYNIENVDGSFSIHNAGTTTYITIHDNSLTSGDATAFKTAMNGVQLVYPLATPIVYQLTPVQVKTLLGYNNIWTDSGTVTVSVPNMISVVNEGNTTAKPTMTIYGRGNIGVWLNGTQVFQIALGDTGNITIDAEQMEAYQGGILRNRLVTGDYSNFVLQKGENTISVTGNVTNVEITNYSRWL